MTDQGRSGLYIMCFNFAMITNMLKYETLGIFVMFIYLFKNYYLRKTDREILLVRLI